MNNENQNKQIENLIQEFEHKIETQNFAPETGSISVEQKLANLNFDTVLNDQEREELDRKNQEYIDRQARVAEEYRKINKKWQFRLFRVLVVLFVIFLVIFLVGSFAHAIMNGETHKVISFFGTIGFIFALMFGGKTKGDPIFISQNEREAIFNKFANNNGLIFESYYYPSGSKRSLFEQSPTKKSDFFTKGEYEFGIISRKVERDDRSFFESFFFVEKTLPFVVQTLVIDSKKSSIIDLKSTLNENLVLLEGSFNEVFDIETEYHRKVEATAFLAPDLMSFLMDNFGDCDFEFFDNKVRILFPNNEKKTFSQLVLFNEMKVNMPRAMKFFEKFNQKFSLLKVDRVSSYKVKAELTEEEKSYRQIMVQTAFVSAIVALFGFFVGNMTRISFFLFFFFISMFVAGLAICGIIIQDAMLKFRLKSERRAKGVKNQSWHNEEGKNKFLLFGLILIAVIFAPLIIGFVIKMFLM